VVLFLVVIGGGIGVGVRALVDGAAIADHADALLIVLAAVGYFLAALLTVRLKKNEIGPLQQEKESASFVQGFRDMQEGFRYLRGHLDASRGIIATAVQAWWTNRSNLDCIVIRAKHF